MYLSLPLWSSLSRRSWESGASSANDETQLKKNERQQSCVKSQTAKIPIFTFGKKLAFVKVALKRRFSNILNLNSFFPHSGHEIDLVSIQNLKTLEWLCSSFCLCKNAYISWSISWNSVCRKKSFYFMHIWNIIIHISRAWHWSKY